MNRTTHTHETVQNALASLKHQLLQELKHRLAQCTTSSRHHSSELLDIVTDGEFDDMTARIAEADSLKIEQIEEALHMLREGRYGICQRCGRAIPRRRLEAIPFATLCIKCKERQEREELSWQRSGHRGARPAQVDFDLTGREPQETAADDVWQDIEMSDVY